MSAWSDAQSSMLLSKHRYADGTSWGYVAAGLVENESTTPNAFTPELISEIFSTFGSDLQSVAQTNELPIEILVAAIALVAERVGTANAASYVEYLPGYISEEDTPELAYAGSTGLRFDRVRALRGPILVVDYNANPATAITTAAEHILAQIMSTAFQPPMVASTYNSEGGVRYDASSRWRMANQQQTDRYLGWWNACVSVVSQNLPLIGPAPSFTAVLMTIAPPQPNTAPTSQQKYIKPESNAAIDEGMMAVCDTSPQLSTIWALDDLTLEQIGAVARDAASGLGLPMSQPTFAYPDRGGVMRQMNDLDVQKLYRAMRDYVTAIQLYDTDRAPNLPGQPVFIP
jgi:hypothetical protein